MTKEQLQEIFAAAFQKMSSRERERYPISVTDLTTDLWPHLGWEDRVLTRVITVVRPVFPIPEDYNGY